MFREFSENSRSEEFLNEFRQKMADQTASNIEERQNEIRRSKSVFIGTLAGLIFAGIIGGFIVAPRYNGHSSGVVPLIKHLTGVVKSAPKDRGGMEIANKDKSVYEILENKQEKQDVVENILPAPEAPMVPTVTVTEEEYVPATIDDLIDSAETEISNEKTETNETVKVKNEADEKNKQTEHLVESFASQTSEQSSNTIPANQEQTGETKDQVTSEPDDSKTLDKNISKEEVPSATVETKATATTGDYQVQIMSAKERDSVINSWEKLKKAHAFFAALPYEIEEADLGSSGIYYRLKVGAYADKEAANKLCDQYKEVKGSCIVKKK